MPPRPADTAGLTAGAALKFLAELGALAGLVIWGASAGPGASSVALAVAAPAVAVLALGRWAAPRSTYRLEPLPRTALEVAVFAAGASGLAVAGHAAAGAVLLVTGIAAEALTLRRATPGGRRRHDD